MTVLPSPIPHPLDFCPWQLPGWIYEALDWVVGVEWPEGNERVVWDLADEWYSVAAALAGPRDDAATAAGEVLSGYGAVGAVAEAFDAAWRKVAEGDEAPLPLLLAVSTDLGRLVEECGCDIEGAKLEVWIELGILVVELLGMTVAVVLTAGAASPAAGAVIAATRFVVQQIFKKLIAQLARKTLKKGMQEATERAAKQVTKDGLRGLGRNVLRGGLFEAAEEGGVNLAIQGYQNSTGRRDGVDLADLGTSALGGLAGGAAAPLAGLGKHASSRGGQFAENLGREMTGEMIADQAASLATGGGLVGLEDAARAAASGATGSMVSQSDAALQARLDGRLNALTSTPLSSPSALVVDPGPAMPTVPPADSTSPPPLSDAATPAVPSPRTTSDLGGDDVGTSTAVSRAYGMESSPGPELLEPKLPTSGSVESGVPADHRTGASPQAASEPVTAAAPPLSAATPSTAPAPVTATPTLSAVTADPMLAASPVTAPAPDLSTTTSSTGMASPAPTASAVGTIGSPTVAAAPAVPVTPGLGSTVPPGPSPTVNSGTAPPVTTVTNTAAGPMANSAPVSNPPVVRAPAPTLPASFAQPKGEGQDRSSLDLSLLEALEPKTPQPRDSAPPPPDLGPMPQHSPEPVPRTPEWYDATWAAEREALERRRYRGYYEAQRAWFEERRRDDLARELRDEAESYYDQARWLIRRAHEAYRSGKRALADQFLAGGREQERLCYQQQDLAEEVRDGRTLPDVTYVNDEVDFRRINDDVAEMATGGVETGNRSALTGDGGPPSIEQTRPYGERGGLRPPLALHQTDLERQMPREPDGSVSRTADPRRGRWFSLVNDGGPSADATRSINCLDCTLSLYETWMHGRPRVSAPRTFDGYFHGDVNRPIDGEWGGPGRVERVTGGAYQQVTPSTEGLSPAAARQRVLQGYADLHQQLLSGGHGSFAFLVNTWEGGGAHAWVALNQNGTVLYLDPQISAVSDRPPYVHRGVSHPGNVASLEALVIGPDGTPMPLAGRGLGDFSEQRTSSADAGEPGGRTDGRPLSRRQPLPTPGQAPSSPDASDTNPKAQDPKQAVRETRDRAYQERIAAGVSVPTAVASATDLDSLFSAGVAPGDAVAELDPANLRRLVPHLDEKAAHELTRLFAEPRVQQMIEDTWRTPPKGEPLLAETLVRQLTQRPDLVAMVLAAPELMASLTARPLTLHHLAEHQQAIDVLTSVLQDISDCGPEVFVLAGTPEPEPTPLTDEQRRISLSIEGENDVVQPGFDQRRRSDSAYGRQYLDDLYAAAAEAQAELKTLAVRLARDGDQQIGNPGWRTAPKDRRRAEDKVSKYHGDASQLCDLAAAKIEFQSLGQLYRALDRLRREPGVRIMSCDDRFQSPQPSGYRDIQLVLEMANGHIAEFRLHLAALDEVAAWEHALYEVRRDLKALARQEGRPLRLMEQAIFDGVLRREQELFWTALLSTCREGEG
ncbi:Papain fold toxin 1, glutamine deamidase [Micromonospora pallida]|uniref:Papain fold toxin 1, glutamine deamidase n=1 Tax=Micromonospora pallida TaxID=145854 RepID=A0A1C6T1X7_9ACTN|nr:toxin glutamine deamidase domain-containing protein [Micromonospora pallida]SCL35355.1 Papain fold toxin 1, glutamine deamidase [Micromonospora pallida]